MGTRSQRALIAAVVIAGLLAGLYAAAPMLLAAAARHYLAGTIQVNELEIDSVGLHETRIDDLRVGDEQMEIGARRAVVKYALWPARIRGIEIEQASVAINDLSPEPGREPRQPAIPALPDYPVRIDNLRVKANTPWGASELSASVRSGRDASGRFEAIVDGNEFTATLASPEDGRYQLHIRNAGDIELVLLNADARSGSPVSFDGRLNLQAAADWLGSAHFVPAELRPMLTRYEISSSGIDFNGTIERGLDFDTTIKGTVALHDRRDASRRSFESLTMKSTAAGYTVTRAGASWSGSGEAALELAVAPGSVATAQDPSWRLADGALMVNALNPAYQTLAASADSIEISAPDFTSSHATGRLSIDGLRMGALPASMTAYRVDGDWTWRNTTLQAEGTGTSAALPALQWSVDLQGGQGNAVVRVLDDVAILEPVLKTYTRAVARELNIKQGRIGGAYRLEWDADGQESSLDISTGPLDADLDAMEIRGLSARVTNHGDGLEELDISVQAPTIKLAAGTVTEELDMTMRLQYPLLHIDAARTRLFAGRFAVRPATIDLSDDEWVLFVDINGLSLEAIMALLELESTQLSGTVTGPVRLVWRRSDGIAINEGKLRSVEPGVLKFSMNPDAETASQLDNIAFRALENFQYDELSASVVYGHDGGYRITARIVGDNPDVLDGHPIALNPDIEGRLPALFRAFFITGDFSRAILENIQEQGSVSTPGQTSTLEED